MSKEMKSTVIQYQPKATKHELLKAYAASLIVAADRQVHHLVAFRSDYDKLRTTAMIGLGLSDEFASATSTLDMSPADLLGQDRAGWYVDLDGTLRNTEITKLPVHWSRDFNTVGLIYPHYYVVLGEVPPNTDDYHYRYEVYRTMQDAANAHKRNLVVSVEA